MSNRRRDKLNTEKTYSYNEQQAYQSIKISLNTLLIFAFYSFICLKITSLFIAGILIFLGTIVIIIAHYFITYPIKKATAFKNQIISIESDKIHLHIYNESENNLHILDIHKIHKLITNRKTITVVADVVKTKPDSTSINIPNYKFKIFRIFEDDNDLIKELAIWEKEE